MSNVPEPPAAFLCPKCGSQVEISAKVWLTLHENGEIVPAFSDDFTSEDSTFYCSQDHKLDDWACDLGLYDALRTWIEPRLADNLPYVVDDGKDVPVGGRLRILAKFATEDLAAQFITTLPERLTGRYGLTGPADG